MCWRISFRTWCHKPKSERWYQASFPNEQRILLQKSTAMPLQVQYFGWNMPMAKCHLRRSWRFDAGTQLHTYVSFNCDLHLAYSIRREADIERSASQRVFARLHFVEPHLSRPRRSMTEPRAGNSPNWTVGSAWGGRSAKFMRGGLVSLLHGTGRWNPSVSHELRRCPC